LAAGPRPDRCGNSLALPQTPELDLRGSLCNKKGRKEREERAWNGMRKGMEEKKGKGKVRTEMRQKVFVPSTLDICHGDATGKKSIST
jgi:hypothetical protein